MARPTNIPKLTIKNKREGVSTGANTQILLNGKPLNGVNFLKLEFHPRRVTKVLIEMYVEVEQIETETALELTDVKPITTGDKCVLGRYTNPKEIK